MSSRYTKEQVDYLKKIAKGRTHKEITEMFNKKFGQDRTAKAIGNALSRRGIKTGLQGHATRFKKGHKTFNKNLSMADYLSEEKIENIKKNWFKKGEVSLYADPIGTERIDEDGWIEIKIDRHTWAKKHRHVWEQEHGEIPHHHAIMFKDGDKENCSLDNLFIVNKNAVTTVAKRKEVTDYPELNELLYKTTNLEIVTNMKEREL